MYAACFLVDLFCLGVKNMSGDRFRSKTEIGMFIMMTYFDGAPERITFDTARDIVYGSVRYAASLGFAPHPDFEHWKYILGDNETSLPGKVRFGDPDADGQPLYIIGPEDDVDAIIATLEQNVGKDGFTVIGPEDFPDD
jgi:hypothetical protein